MSEEQVPASEALVPASEALVPAREEAHPPPGEDQSSPPTSGWWRRNRWALLALPFVLVVVALSGAGRVATFWWPYEMHDRLEGPLGQPVTLVDDYVDAAGTHEREVTITMEAVTPDVLPTDTEGVPITDEPMPPGTRVWGVEFIVEADPETVLTGCRIELVDAQGRVSPRNTSLLPWQVTANACEPHDTTNPQATLFVDDEEGDPSTRPPAYARSVQVAVAQEFVPVEVRLWWEPPTYLAVPLPAAAP